MQFLSWYLEQYVMHMRIFGMRMQWLLHWLRVTFYVRVMSYYLLHELRELQVIFLSNFVVDIIFVCNFAALLKNDNQEVILILETLLFVSD